MNVIVSNFLVEMKNMFLHKFLFITILIFLMTSVFGKESDLMPQRLESARKFVENFLHEDANPNEVFLGRDAKLLAHKNEPLNDCAFQGYVRAIKQIGNPKFEKSSKTVVLVPVVAELLMVFAQNDGGEIARPGVKQYSWCGFEYERYDFSTNRFERIPEFRKHTHNEEFAQWGAVLNVWRSPPLPAGTTPDRYVLIDLDKRYVRYYVRVNIENNDAYRLWPQVPRHWYAKDVLSELNFRVMKNNERIEKYTQMIKKRSIDENAMTEIDVLKHRMDDSRWMYEGIANNLKKLEGTPSLSDIVLNQ